MIHESYTGIVKPKKIISSTSNDGLSAKFVIEPIQSGFGITIANSLRRVLLSSIRGSVISSVSIDGIGHEYTGLHGVIQDTVQICLNLKKVVIKTDAEISNAELFVSGPCIVTAGMISVPMGVEIVNKDQFLFEISTDIKVKMSFKIKSGIGYIVHNPKSREREIGEIDLDCYFSPIKNVNFSVDNARVDGFTEFDKVTMNIETNGAISPSDALSVSAAIMRDFLKVAVNFDDEDRGITDAVSDKKQQIDSGFDLNLLRRTDELELSVRSANCLSQAEIKYIGELVQKTKEDMLRMPNFGRKSLDELCHILDSMKLKFGMTISWPPKDMDQLLEQAKKKFENE